MKKTIWWMYLNLIRSWTSPLLYWVYRYTKYLTTEFPNIWDNIKDLNIDDFCKEIKKYDKYDYLSDPLMGLLDYSPQEKNFFFVKRDSSRDCDDWSRMWKWYFDYHNVKNKELLLKGEDGAHVVTVAKFKDGWELFDYIPTQKREKTFEKTLKNNRVGYKNFFFLELKG